MQIFASVLHNKTESVDSVLRGAYCVRWKSCPSRHGGNTDFRKLESGLSSLRGGCFAGCRFSPPDTGGNRNPKKQTDDGAIAKW